MSDHDDDEDEKTPPRQPTPRPYRMSDSERDARRGLLHGHPVRRSGVPSVMPEPADEITAPIELLLNGQLTAEDYAQVEALRRSQSDLHVLVMNVAKALARYREQEKSGSKAIEKQVIAAIEASQRQLDEIGRRIDAVVADRVRFATSDEVAKVRGELGERQTQTKGSIHENLGKLLGTHRTARWLAGVALAAALSALGYVATAIKTSGADEIRRDRTEHDVDQIQQDIRDIRRELRRKDSP